MKRASISLFHFFPAALGVISLVGFLDGLSARPRRANASAALDRMLNTQLPNKLVSAIRKPMQ